MWESPVVVPCTQMWVEGPWDRKKGEIRVGSGVGGESFLPLVSVRVVPQGKYWEGVREEG